MHLQTIVSLVLACIVINSVCPSPVTIEDDNGNNLGKVEQAQIDFSKEMDKFHKETVSMMKEISNEMSVSGHCVNANMTAWKKEFKQRLDELDGLTHRTRHELEKEYRRKNYELNNQIDELMKDRQEEIKENEGKRQEIHADFDEKVNELQREREETLKSINDENGEDTAEKLKENEEEFKGKYDELVKEKENRLFDLGTRELEMQQEYEDKKRGLFGQKMALTKVMVEAMLDGEGERQDKRIEMFEEYLKKKIEQVRKIRQIKDQGLAKLAEIQQDRHAQFVVIREEHEAMIQAMVDEAREQLKERIGQ